MEDFLVISHTKNSIKNIFSVNSEEVKLITSISPVYFRLEMDESIFKLIQFPKRDANEDSFEGDLDCHAWVLVLFLVKSPGHWPLILSRIA